MASTGDAAWEIGKLNIYLALVNPCDTFVMIVDKRQTSQVCH